MICCALIAAHQLALAALRFDLCSGGIDRARRDEVLFEQIFGARELALKVGERGFGSLCLGLCFAEIRLNTAVIQFKQYIAGADGLSFFHRDAPDQALTCARTGTDCCAITLPVDSSCIGISTKSMVAMRRRQVRQNHRVCHRPHQRHRPVRRSLWHSSPLDCRSRQVCRQPVRHWVLHQRLA